MQLSMAGLAARGGMAVARPFGLAAPPQRQRRPTQRPVVVAKANADEERPLYSHWVARLQACMQLQAVATHERISEPELSELAWLVVLANVGVLVCAAAPSTLWGVALAVALCRWQVPRVFLSKVLRIVSYGCLLCAIGILWYHAGLLGQVMAKPIVWAVTAGFSQQPRSQPVIAVIGAAAFLLTLAPAISYLAKFIRKAPGA